VGDVETLAYFSKYAMFISNKTEN